MKAKKIAKEWFKFLASHNEDYLTELLEDAYERGYQDCEKKRDWKD